MAETSTTLGQWKRCVNAGVCQGVPEDFSPGSDYPVVLVSKGAAEAFCGWSGGRLPTEAEWEYAARGGKDGLRYPSGNVITHNDSNYGEELPRFGGKVEGKDLWMTTSPVKSFAPNGFGLYDMAGNVSNWVSDWFGFKYYKSSPNVDPKGPASPFTFQTGEDGWTVTRGGSWATGNVFSTVYRRSYHKHASDKFPDTGFRCVRDGAP